MTVATLQYASAAFAFFAAILWYLSARVKIPETFSNTVFRAGSFQAKWLSNGFPNSQIVGQGESTEFTELGRALTQQGTWSKRAAACACAAALLQGVATLADQSGWLR